MAAMITPSAPERERRHGEGRRGAIELDSRDSLHVGSAASRRATPGVQEVPMKIPHSTTTNRHLMLAEVATR
jgi:hypothetical protein